MSLKVEQTLYSLEHLGHEADLTSLYLGVSEHQMVGEFLTENLYQEGWGRPLYLPFCLQPQR